MQPSHIEHAIDGASCKKKEMLLMIIAALHTRCTTNGMCA